ncbi:MAG: FAD-dependent oxidoreductase [Candidatus Pacearchaeota archaeon]
MAHKKVYIIGAGFTGLAAALSTGFPIFEAKNHPGGICYSYSKRNFKFERGGGHWIFGADENVKKVISRFSKLRRYQRKAGIFFAGNLGVTKAFKYKIIPYPIQNNLRYLGGEIAAKVLKEILNKSDKNILTLDDWLVFSFGETLYNIFFKPFHEKYTAGLYKKIAPQDTYKSPFSISDVIDGAFGINKSEAGYNISFLYPKNGLNFLADRMAERCNIKYNKELKRLNISEKKIIFSDKTTLEYDYLITTIPLNNLLKMSEFKDYTLPYTSVLVLNAGVELGNSKIAKHGYHWLYIPDAKSKFHRIGYYSNVDPEIFLPKGLDPDKYGSLYIEFAFRGGENPKPKDLEILRKNTFKELKEWGFIKNVLVSDFTWIDVAYTWNIQNSNQVNKIINQLREKGIYSIGRFGGWNFQGIAKSIKEGIQIGLSLKNK